MVYKPGGGGERQAKHPMTAAYLPTGSPINDPDPAWRVCELRKCMWDLEKEIEQKYDKILLIQHEIQQCEESEAAKVH